MGISESRAPAGGLSRAAGSQANAGWPAIDWFRIAAAVLVVANHTSPLLSVNPTADFILTRVICRLAVPFFFMASGFFMGAAKVPHALRRFVLKTCRLYAISIVLYLPLNLYAGYFAQPGLAGHILGDLFWNGSFYHLWYFPAAVLGGVIAWILVRRCHPALALGITGALYLLGLLGDSWHGLAAGVPALANLYSFFFSLFHYTRNGLFFAPLFMVMGMLAARRPRPAGSFLPAGAGFLACFGAMLAEALWLRSMGWPRHDSMYLLLPLCSWLLFTLLRRPTGSGRHFMRGIAGWVYILHPWAIVLVRRGALILRAVNWLLASSPLFFSCVCLLSFCLAAIAVLALGRFKGPRTPKKQRVWAELDETALRHNLSEMQALLPPGAKVMAVLKANAYGHGALWAARRLRRAGVKAFAVATLEEGVYLRRRGLRGSILVLGYTPPQAAARLWFYRLTQTLADGDHARQLAAQKLPLRAQIKIDTGMHRLGLPAENTAEVAGIYKLPHLRITGLYTHLARADGRTPEDQAFTDRQTECYYTLLEELREQGIDPGQTHLQSSYGLLARPGLPCHFARLGIALYGSPAAGFAQSAAALRPVLALRARVASVRRIPAGSWVGYGNAWQCPRASTIATLTLGYADGIPRSMAGGQVLIRGRSAPVVGRVCMDQMSVDVTNVAGVQAGDIVTLLGRDGEAEITLDEMAAHCGTIPNELLVRLGARVKRIALPHNLKRQWKYTAMPLTGQQPRRA